MHLHPLAEVVEAAMGEEVAYFAVPNVAGTIDVIIRVRELK